MKTVSIVGGNEVYGGATKKVITRSVGTITDPKITADVSDRQSRIDDANAGKEKFLKAWQAKLGEREKKAVVREEVVKKKEADSLRTIEQLRKREALIRIYEASQREAQEELDRRSKGLDDGLATISNIRKNMG